jgi:hypothetical protein
MVKLFMWTVGCGVSLFNADPVSGPRGRDRAVVLGLDLNQADRRDASLAHMLFRRFAQTGKHRLPNQPARESCTPAPGGAQYKPVWLREAAPDPDRLMCGAVAAQWLQSLAPPRGQHRAIYREPS